MSDRGGGDNGQHEGGPDEGGLGEGGLGESGEIDFHDFLRGLVVCLCVAKRWRLTH